MKYSIRILKILRPIVIVVAILVALILFFQWTSVFNGLELMGIFVLLSFIIIWIWYGSGKFIKSAEVGDRKKLTRTIFLFMVIALIITLPLYYLISISTQRVIDNPPWAIDPTRGY